MGSEHNVCVLLNIVCCGSVVYSTWTEVTVPTGLKLAFGAQVVKGWGSRGQKAGVGNPSGRRGR